MYDSKGVHEFLGGAYYFRTESTFGSKIEPNKIV